jgi:hypothetical protein
MVLLALVGGVSMGALAAARRTQAAYPTYLASSRASDLQLFVYRLASPTGSSGQAITKKLAAIPQVSHVSAAPNIFLAIHEPPGTPQPPAIVSADVSFIGSQGGAYFSVDRPVVQQGRMSNPRSPDELVASKDAARLLGWHVGERIAFDVYSVAQVDTASSFPPHGPPVGHATATLVGLVDFASQVAHDDADQYPTYVLATPAMTHRFSGIEGFTAYELRLRNGQADVSVVERELASPSLLPPGSVYAFHLTSIVEGQVERAIRPESIALAVFGAIAAAAALLIGAQAIRRQVLALRSELVVARALGADRTALVIASSLDPLLAVAGGALLAAVVALALSPLAPIGAVRAVDPSPSAHADWVVLVAGMALLVVVLAAFAVVSGLAVTRRKSGVRAEVATRRSVVSDAAARAGLPAPLVAGLRFSLERGSGRTQAPVRSALVAAVVAVVVVVSTVTFASGLATLNSHPPLYGWNWSYAIDSPTGSNVPPIVATELRKDPDVASFAGYTFANALFDGVTVPIDIKSASSSLGPALLAGHDVVVGERQVVLGQLTLDQLHKKLGDTVTITYGNKQDYPVYVPPTPLRIVGIATMPAIGASGNLHTSMGIGAEVEAGIEPAAFHNALTSPDPNLNGPSMFVVRLKPGVAASDGLLSLRRIARDATRVMAADPNVGGVTYAVLGAQRPAEIAIYQSTGSTPAVLALGLAFGAVAALGLALASSVRRRRRDLALLKTLGFRRRQLAATIAWQASTVAVVGSIFGVPLGIALGRWLWTLFAQQISVVPEPTVPVAQVVVIVALAIVLANVVAAVPGRIAARTPAALVLRSE